MARPNESAVQRIQVGVLGLLGVLLFVYIANFLVNRVAQPVENAEVVDPQVQAADNKPKDEPLAELGVTPMVEESKQAEPQNNALPQR